MKCLKTPYHKELKELIVGYNKEVKINSSNLRGIYRIQNIRFYNFTVMEVDIIFEGELYGRMYSKFDWLKSEILTNPRVSKIKINRRLRKNLQHEISRRLNYFGLPNLYNYDLIKKINWK
jgi:hypothetical protein